MILITLILGFLFGALLQLAKLNKFNTISGMATLDNLTVAKAIAFTIGIGAILLNIEIGLGIASYHVKPFILGGIIIGGLVFGMGMAILGYCPGTLAISFGEGSMDALIGIAGGLVGGLVYTLILPSMQGILGPDLGKISLHSLIGTNQVLFYLLVFIMGGLFIAISFWLQKIEKTKSHKWLYAGLGLAILNPVIFLTTVSNRPIGASTAYPYFSDLLTKTTENEYFSKISGAGHWELIFLLGSFISGLVFSILRKDFQLVLIHDNWKKYKGTNPYKRAIWSFVGGFVLIIGARMAGGCTSGHILSGGMQLAVSSLVFFLFVFAGLLITGKLFYRMGKG